MSGGGVRLIFGQKSHLNLVQVQRTPSSRTWRRWNHGVKVRGSRVRRGRYKQEQPGTVQEDKTWSVRMDLREGVDKGTPRKRRISINESIVEEVGRERLTT